MSYQNQDLEDKEENINNNGERYDEYNGNNYDNISNSDDKNSVNEVINNDYGHKAKLDNNEKKDNNIEDKISLFV